MTHHATTKRSGIRLFRYIGEIINELRKVVWLSRREVAYLTVLVLIVAIVAGIVLGAFDYGFTGLVDKVFWADKRLPIFQVELKRDDLQGNFCFFRESRW